MITDNKGDELTPIPVPGTLSEEFTRYMKANSEGIISSYNGANLDLMIIDEDVFFNIEKLRKSKEGYFIYSLV